jgi:ATP-binding cassette, subfamily B, multidrug efflux pump
MIEIRKNTSTLNFVTATSILNFARNFAFIEWRWYILGIVAMAITNIITLKIPQFAKQIVDLYGIASPSKLESIALLIIALGFLQIAVRTLSRLFIFWPARKVETSSKSYLFARLMVLPQSFFQSHGMGDLVSRISNDLTHIRVFFGFCVLQLLNLIFLMTFTITQMMSTHMELSLFALSPLVLLIIVLKITLPIMHKYSLENQTIIGNLTNRATETFVNIHAVKANGSENSFWKRLTRENQKVYESNIRLSLVRQIVFPIIGLLTSLSQVIVVGYGGYQAYLGHITAGDIMAFNIYITYMAFPLAAFGIIISATQRATTALQRLRVIEQSPPESPLIKSKLFTSTVTQKLEEFAQNMPLRTPINPPFSIEIKNLNFAFPPQDEKQVESPFGLRDININIPPGIKLGIWGPVGSGKSTLLNLLTGMIAPPSKAIFINGYDISEICPQDLRQLIGYAQQQVHLFSDTITRNVTFGLGNDFAPEDIKRAIELSCLNEEIERLPKKLETTIGERGVRLSGGQRQRLSLARLFIRNAPVMILDDVLSSVDQTTERKLIQNLSTLQNSLIIVSHRLDILDTCDQVLVLKDGSITDRGTMRELETRNPEIASQREHT